MRLVCITDLHGATAVLQRILEQAGRADAILLGGDITHFGSPIDAERTVRLAQGHAPLVLAVVGNTDSATIDKRLVELGVAAHRRGIVCGAVGLHGLSGIPPWRKGMFGLTEEELAAALESGYAQIAGCSQHILLAHVPPWGGPSGESEMSLDRTHSGVHAGSTAVRKFIDERRPALVLCGHIHEARGIDQLGATTVVNCGHGAVGYYALVETGEDMHVDLRRA